MKVLIDNGHGENTPGKHSPDGRLREYAYTREIAIRVMEKLHAADIDVQRIVTEETDVPLVERVARANKIYAECGKQAILISIHCNAMGSGAEWMPARGWSVFVGGNASQQSKLLAEALAQAAQDKKVKLRKPSPQQLYWTADLFICRKTNCPAVLIENFFQDNLEDVEFLLSENGKQCVTDIMMAGIKEYLKV